MKQVIFCKAASIRLVRKTVVETIYVGVDCGYGMSFTETTVVMMLLRYGWYVYLFIFF